MLGLSDKLLNFVYPIGSYYETSDFSFNPNTSWGGTWVEDSKGLVLVALDENDVDFDTIGKTGGSKYLQEHAHNYSRSRLFAGEEGRENFCYGTTNLSALIETPTGKAGNGDSGNLQPYTVVKRWHRIA